MPNRNKADEIHSSWWRSSLLRLYENLTRNDAVQPVDLIFVMAGRMERKQYGLELFRAGVSPKLVLSIGRGEVSKMCNLDLEGIDDLMIMRGQTSPDERHFFMIEGSTTQLTLSFGVAGFAPGSTGARENLIDAADRALYEAKARGRNCVEVYEPASAHGRTSAAYAQP